MAHQIIETTSAAASWPMPLGEPSARRLLSWGQAQADECLTDVFGYHAVQAGWPGFDALRTSRMPHRWLARQEFDEALAPAPALCFDSRAWPWAAESLDLVLLPHTLERSADPQACLREVERVLIPEGHLFILGLNPWSLWGRQFRAGKSPEPAPQLATWPVRPIAPHRLRDWLHLLGFEIQQQRLTGWTPTWQSERWVERWAWLDTLGRQWCPWLGGAYMMLATKRVHGGRLLNGRAWRTLPSRPNLAAPVASIDAPVRHTSTPESLP